MGGRVAGGVEGGVPVVVRVASEGELGLGFKLEGMEESRDGWDRERRRVAILVLLSEREGVSRTRVIDKGAEPDL